MKKLADEIKSMDIHPGIWLRPLLTAEFVPDEYYIKAADGGKLSDEYILKNNLYRTMDPSEPFVLAKIAEDVKTLADWGYELMKFDFTTLDLMHRPGSAWGEDFTDGGWTFVDKSKTTAQILKNMYKTIREAAGENAIVIGCNTIGHLGTGYFEMQRTGGDTSGDEWDRTRRMGVNTLAFRMPQHGIFYDIDADCVGITKNITWQQNREWLRLLSVSGTPLFVSVAEDAYNDEVKAALAEAFEKAEKNTVPARSATDSIQKFRRGGKRRSANINLTGIWNKAI